MHPNLLPNGKVLAWDSETNSNTNPRLFDPVAGTFVEATLASTTAAAGGERWPADTDFRVSITNAPGANANAVRDWRIYASFAERLIGIARKLYINEPFGVAVDSAGNVYVADYLNHTIRKITSGGVVTMSRP